MGYEDTRIRGYRGYKDMWDTRVHGMISGIRGYEDTGDIWDTNIHGSKDTRILGICGIQRYEDTGVTRMCGIEGYIG